MGRDSRGLLFINTQGPAVSKDRRTTRQIRSHAVSAALALERRQAEERGENFRVASVDESNQPRPSCDVVPAPSGYLGAASVDPFETLSIEARRLTVLLHEKKSLCAGEPVFNTNDAVHYQTLHSVFQTGLSDGALTASLGLVMSLAANGGKHTKESIMLSTTSLQHVRRKLSDPDTAATPATIGTILLLLGIEYRSYSKENVQHHLQGLEGLLQLCARKSIFLPLPLRRAIYWQDLFSSIFVGTRRIVDYKRFHPGEHAPRVDLGPCHEAPEGFMRRATHLGPEFITIISDVAAIYNMRPTWHRDKTTDLGLQKLTNSQAYLEGRLHELRQSTSDDMVVSCIIAAFLCVFACWTDVWNSALIPRCMSNQLLHHMQGWQSNSDERDPELLFWLLHIGKAFAIDAQTRRGLAELEASADVDMEDIARVGDDARSILDTFIWSEVFYEPRGGWFWERIRQTT